jgi:MOSC domain-containing protein YiiM
VKVVAVSVGSPRQVQSGATTVLTSIFKSPVSGRVAVREHNLEGDRQSDLTVHGGVHKAVYVYPSEHYAFWRAELSIADLPWGSFGENLTTAGVTEQTIHIGDRIRIGSAEFVVTQPRTPCFKLGIRFARPEMVKRFLQSRRSGFYLSIATAGDVGADDAIEIVSRSATAVSIRELLDMYLGDSIDESRLRAALEEPALPPGWRTAFQKRLEAETS